MKKVNKQKARRLYAEGKPITLIPCKCALYPNLLNGISQAIQLVENGQFDAAIAEYTQKSCNALKGRYPLYWIQ